MQGREKREERRGKRRQAEVGGGGQVRVRIWFHLWKHGFRVELLKRFRQLILQGSGGAFSWVYRPMGTGET